MNDIMRIVKEDEPASWSNHMIWIADEAPDT
mgnify:CR=1 FL=1